MFGLVVNSVGKRNIKFALHSKNISIFKTLYFNFKAFPFRKAIRFPFLVGRKVKIRNIGKIVVTTNIETAMFTLGVFYNKNWESTKDHITIFGNRGTLQLDGFWNAYIGSKIYISKDASITFKGYNNIGYNSKIICFESIEFGRDTSTSWDCEIFDTNFHNLKDMVSKKILKKTSPVRFGDGVFIGNNTSIHQGTKIPNYCVISSFSRVSGSFTKEGENLLILGNPAKVVDKGYKMLIKEYKDYIE